MCHGKDDGWYTLSDLTLNKYNNSTITTTLDNSALQYRDKSSDFMGYITSTIEGTGTSISKIVKENEVEILTTDPENPESLFNQHKRKVIRDSIQDNMNNAIAIYNANASSLGTSSFFSMPKLSEADWEKIVTNVNIVTFMQGLAVGTKTYNDYAIVTSTNNKQYIDPETIYFVTNTGYYHTLEHIANVTDDNINVDSIIGYKYADFKKVKYEYKNINEDKISRYYYRREEYACYDCIVSTNAITETRTKYEILNPPSATTRINKLKEKYYTALARERFNLDKTTKILLNGS